MLIARASRRELDKVRQFYDAHDWYEKDEDPDLARGTVFIARQGPIVGAVRLIEVAPQVVVIEDVLVSTDHRRDGVGSRLINAAMSSRGGKVYLCCHDDVIGFYERFGFAELPYEDQPEAAKAFFVETGGWPTEPGHVHRFLTAR